MIYEFKNSVLRNFGLERLKKNDGVHQMSSWIMIRAVCNNSFTNFYYNLIYLIKISLWKIRIVCWCKTFPLYIYNLNTNNERKYVVPLFSSLKIFRDWWKHKINIFTSCFMKFEGSNNERATFWNVNMTHFQPIWLLNAIVLNQKHYLIFIKIK